MVEILKDEAGTALNRIRRHMRILVDIGRLTSESSDVARFLDQVAVQIARAVEINHVKILQYRQREADLLVAAGIGWKEGVVRSATLPAIMRSPPGRAFQTAQPVTITNLNEQSEYIISDFLKEHGIVALTNVPLLMNGAAWGVVEVDSTTPRDFNEDTTDFLTAAGVLIGAFLECHRSPSDEAARLLAEAAESYNRDVLLREMQHRVKNNFQLVLSSIAMQKQRFAGTDVHHALDHIASRINAISLAHDQLAPRDEGKSVKLSNYLRALCASIAQQAEGIEVVVEADELELSINRAVPLGLILNEIAINSIKHAFDAPGGRISVKLAGGVGYGEGRLTVSDNGRGIQKANPKGSGLKLISALARQIGGTVEQQSSDHGATTSLRFPLIN
jgi:two-component system, sensor histidine kinase PdtaS